MRAIKIFPSLISSNLINIEKTLVELGPVCDGFHIDVMDNHFVPNLTWGPSFVNQIAQYTNKPLSIHLMVENPETIIEQLRVKQKSIIIVHQSYNLL
jgi:ribulose-phosphate 3-epimerase